MELFLYILILAVLLGLYYILKTKSETNQDYVQCVEAGPMDDVDASFLKRKSFCDRHVVVRNEKGVVLDRNQYSRLVVNGNCMNKRKIYHGDQIIAEKVSANDAMSLKRILQKDNIVWLYIDETGIDKIRIFDQWEGDEMKTYYFKNGGICYSSHNHRVSQVKGIVRYKI